MGTTPAPLRNSNSNHQPTSFLTPLTPTLHDCTFRLSVLIPFYLCLRPSRLSSCLPRNSFRLPTLPSYLCCSSARNVSSFNYSFAPFPVDISLIPSLSTPPRHPSIHWPGCRTKRSCSEMGSPIRSHRWPILKTLHQVAHSRSQRGTASQKLQALPSGYPPVKEKAGPCVLKRGDGQWVKLICIDCQRHDFSSTQGFINHCRIY